jgi:hypothetical protein
MHDLKFVLEEFEPTDHVRCDSCENVLGDADAIESIETAGVHVFHAIVDTRLYEERAVKVDNLRGDGAMENVEFHEDRV